MKAVSKKKGSIKTTKECQIIITSNLASICASSNKIVYLSRFTIKNNHFHIFMSTCSEGLCNVFCLIYHPCHLILKYYL